MNTHTQRYNPFAQATKLDSEIDEWIAKYQVALKGFLRARYECGEKSSQARVAEEAKNYARDVLDAAIVAREALKHGQ